LPRVGGAVITKRKSEMMKKNGVNVLSFCNPERIFERTKGHISQALL
jgi:shikimate kinase